MNSMNWSISDAHTKQSSKLLDRVNCRSERMWQIYFKFVSGTNLVVTVVFLAAILYIWLMSDSFHRDTIVNICLFVWVKSTNSYFCWNFRFVLCFFLEFHGITRHCLAVSLRYSWAMCMALPISLLMAHFCCSFYRFVCIIRHFMKCFNAPFNNWILLTKIATKNNYFAI